MAQAKKISSLNCFAVRVKLFREGEAVRLALSHSVQTVTASPNREVAQTNLALPLFCETRHKDFLQKFLAHLHLRKDIHWHDHKVSLVKEI